MKNRFFFFLAFVVSMSYGCGKVGTEVSMQNSILQKITVKNKRIIFATKNESLINPGDVDYVEYIRENVKGEVKVFSVSGGDPAMNGAYVHLAVFVNNVKGWNVFELDNVFDFKVLKSNKEGFVKLKLLKDTLNSEGEVIHTPYLLYINIKKSTKGSIEVQEVETSSY